MINHTLQGHNISENINETNLIILMTSYDTTKTSENPHLSFLYSNL